MAATRAQIGLRKELPRLQELRLGLRGDGGSGQHGLGSFSRDSVKEGIFGFYVCGLGSIFHQIYTAPSLQKQWYSGIYTLFLLINQFQ